VRAAAPLEGLAPGEWACFERALVVRDIFTGGVRTFLSREDAQAFRAQLYAQHGAHRAGLVHAGAPPGHSDSMHAGVMRDLVCAADLQHS